MSTEVMKLIVAEAEASLKKAEAEASLKKAEAEASLKTADASLKLAQVKRKLAEMTAGKVVGFESEESIISTTTSTNSSSASPLTTIFSPVSSLNGIAAVNTQTAVAPRKRKFRQSSTSLANLRIDDTAAPIQEKKQERRSHAPLTTEKGTKIKVKSSERYRWLFEGHCAGDRSRPITQVLEIPPAYFPELDANALSDNPPNCMQPQLQEWQMYQPEVAQHVTNVLRTHLNKVSCSLASVALQRRKKVENGRISEIEQLSSPNSEEEATVTDSRRENKTVDIDDIDSDWEEDFRTDSSRLPEQRWGAGSQSRRPITDPRCLMSDELYVEIIKVLLHPEIRLKILDEQQPDLAKQLRRLLVNRHRFQVFWAHMYLTPDPNQQSIVPVCRIIPFLCHVDGVCSQEIPDFSLCSRAIPISQVAHLLNVLHRQSNHLRDIYSTVILKYKNVPRKAVQYFGSVCIGCKRSSKRVRNKNPSRAIIVETVRQRYVLDLIDMQEWQKSWSGNGNKCRYVAHMIDHASKFKWATGLADKTAQSVLKFVQNIFWSFGHPVVLHTDNGKEFANSVLEEECRRWGTYMVHGRPYHPQSQGVIERPNGDLQNAMKKYVQTHPKENDWTNILGDVMISMNGHVHSVTRLCPREHFQRYNLLPRERNPLGPDVRILLTVQEAEAMEALKWMTSPYVVPLGDNTGLQQNNGNDSASASASANVILPSPTNTVVTLGNITSNSTATDTDIQERTNGSTACSRNTTTSVSLCYPSTESGRSVRIDPASPINVNLCRIHCLPRGELGEFTDPGWNYAFGIPISQRLYRRGTVANGDSGPDSANMSINGQDARVEDAGTLRNEVLQYMLSREGRLKYQKEKKQPVRAVEEIIEECKAKDACVGREWFTCFGNMMDLNVFVLSKKITHREALDIRYDIRLVTNSGSLIKSDSANTVALYFQEEVHGQTQTRCHWESVWNEYGEHIWRFDDYTVRNCLELALGAMKLRITRAQQVKKMLTANENKRKITNEAIRKGDIVWLTVPNKVIAATKLKLGKKVGLRFTDVRMLVKIWKVDQKESPLGRDITERFTLLSQDGLLENSYPISELEVCQAPPSSHPVLKKEVDENSSSRIPLTQAYTLYCKWNATHSNIMQPSRSVKKRKSGSTVQQIEQLPPQLPSDPASVSNTYQSQLLTVNTDQNEEMVPTSSSQVQSLDEMEIEHCSDSESVQTHQKYNCATCDLPVEIAKVWCSVCLKYVHKKVKGQGWCTRKGWERGGTTMSDGLVICVGCRFAKDEEWLDFTKAIST